MLRSVKFSVVVFLAFLLVLPYTLSAQQVAGLTGVVTDNTGAVVPGVTVKLTNTETGAEYTTTTNDVGVFLFVTSWLLRPAPPARQPRWGRQLPR